MINKYKLFLNILIIMIVFMIPDIVYAADCSSILGDLVPLLKDSFDFVRIAGVGLVFILTTVDFAKALIAQDQDQLKKSSSTAIKRLILALFLFFLPLLLNLLLGLIDNVGGTCI